jgi:hypothetical protein
MQQTSLGQRFFSDTARAADATHHQSIKFNGLARDLYKNFSTGKDKLSINPTKKKKKVKKPVKKLKSFEAFDAEKSREEMILQLCNSGYERWELEEYADDDLKDLCKEVPEEFVSENYTRRKKKR